MQNIQYLVLAYSKTFAASCVCWILPIVTCESCGRTAVVHVWYVPDQSFRPVFPNLLWFVAPFQRLSTLVTPCLSIKIPNFVLGFAISRQSYLVKASARGLRRTALWPRRGPRAVAE